MDQARNPGQARKEKQDLEKQSVYSLLFKTIYEFFSKRKMFPDNATKREMRKLPVVCSNSGCAWIGSFKELEIHLTTCPQTCVQCTVCDMKNKREKITRVTDEIQHLNQSIEYLKLQQALSNDKITAIEMHQRSNNEKCMELEETTGILEGFVFALHTEIEKTNAAFKRLMEQNLQKIRTLERNIVLKEAAIAELYLRVQTLESQFILKFGDRSQTRAIRCPGNCGFYVDPTNIDRHLDTAPLSRHIGPMIVKITDLLREVRTLRQLQQADEARLTLLICTVGTTHRDCLRNYAAMETLDQRVKDLEEKTDQNN